MKRLIVTFTLLAFISCKNKEKEAIVVSENDEIAAIDAKYPDALRKVLNAHGGLKNWKSQRTLIYDMAGDRGETHTIDLYTRKDRVDAANFTMGFDGDQVWIADAEGNYKGDPIFYHNLIFYFYAMPFVLADNGIQYSHTEDLVVGEKQYPGIRISYGEGVGTSPKDEYFIHYDPTTYQMAWLGYTVTYRSGEKSDKVSWINYNDWTTLDDVTLPKSITWHINEGKTIKEARNTLVFENMSVSKTPKPDTFYAKPENAVVATPKTK